MTSYSFFFFFQAEDGIRDGRVTGVQTCALPIYRNFFFSQNSMKALTVSACVNITIFSGSCSSMVSRATTARAREIGRASCREREWRGGGAGAVKKRKVGG